MEDGPAARRGAQPLPQAMFPWDMMLLPTAPHAAQRLMLPGLRGVAWPDLPPGRVQSRLPGTQNRVPASDMDRPGAHAVLPHGRQGLPWAAQGARVPEDRWAARRQAPIPSLSPTEQPAAHLHLAEQAEHAAYRTDIEEFVDGGAVFPRAPRPPGNNYFVNGAPYTVGGMNAVGLGSNKARTDAISKWLGLVPGEAANASVKPSYEVPKYEVSALNAIGQGSNAARIDAIDRFLEKAKLRGDEGWEDQPFSKEHRTKKRGDAH